MASFTEYLKLLKKNPATDGKDTFNIETMLNENWEKIDTKVEENSSAIGQIAKERGYITPKSLSGRNLDTITLTGKYFAHSSCTNAPKTPHQGHLEVTTFSEGWTSQRFQADTFESTVFVREKVGGVWGAWKEVMVSDDVSNPNLAHNGDFQVWQRGISFPFSIAFGATYTADRWYFWNQGGVSSAVKNGNGITINRTGGVNAIRLGQAYIGADIKSLAGKKVTVSFDYSSNATFSVYAGILNELAISAIPISAVNTRHKFTFTMPSIINDSDTFHIFIQTDTVVSTFNLSKFKFELGGVATPFSPRPYAEELANCKRYYQVVSATALGSARVHRKLTTSDFTQMRVTPTVQKVQSPATFSLNCVHEFGFSDYILGTNSRFIFSIYGSEFCELYAGHNGANIDMVNYACYIYLDAEIY